MTSRIDHNATFVPVRFWSPANQGFYKRYREWLVAGGYSRSALEQYTVVLRLAISILGKEYWQIDLNHDVVKVLERIDKRYGSAATRQSYHKGLHKLVEYLANIQGRPKPPKPINWAYFLDGLPDWLGDQLRAYLHVSQRNWLPDVRLERGASLIGRLTQVLRWTNNVAPLTDIADIAPDRWFAYVDARLNEGISPVSLNGDLATLIGFLLFVRDGGTPICERLLQVERLKQAAPMPKDVAPERLCLVQLAISDESQRDHRAYRRMGLMDKAWFLLMLHCGLRVGEVRRLLRSDIDLTDQRIRIEQSKGLKDRIVYLSPDTVLAIQGYLPLRGMAASDHLFIYRHRPLTVTYCAHRLRTYGQRCGVTVTPHQLRHSCATLLLNAGAPIVTVQRLLGHRHIDTTLGYARLYDHTIADDYFTAMQVVEQRLSAVPSTDDTNNPTANLLNLVNQLSNDGDADQQALIQQLKSSIRQLAYHPNVPIDTDTRSI